MTRGRWCWWWVFSACAGGTPSDGDTDPSPSMQLGVGLYTPEGPCAGFRPVSDGDDVAMVHGPQGGWHVDLAVRGEGLPELVDLTTRLVDEQTGVAMTYVDPIQYTLRLVSEDGPETWNGRGCALGLQSILDPTSVGTPDAEEPWRALAGRTLRAEVTLAADGLSLSDQRVFVLRPDPCDLDLEAPGCLCDPDAAFRPDLCDDTDPGG